MRGTVLATLLALTSATYAENVQSVNINGNSQTWVNGKQVGGPKNHQHGKQRHTKPWGSWESTTVNGKNNIVNGKPVKDGVSKTVTQGTGPFGWGSTTQTTITGNGNVVSRRALDSLLDDILEAREAPAVYRRGGNIVSTVQSTDIDVRSLLARRYLQDLIEARAPPAKKDKKPKRPAQKNFVNVQGSGNTVNGKPVSGNSVTTSTSTGGNWWDNLGVKTETTINGNGMNVQVREADPEADAEADAYAEPDAEAEPDLDLDYELFIRAPPAPKKPSAQKNFVNIQGSGNTVNGKAVSGNSNTVTTSTTNFGGNWWDKFGKKTETTINGNGMTVQVRDAEVDPEAYADPEAEAFADPDAEADPEIDIDYELFIRAAPPATPKNNKPTPQKNIVNVQGKGNTINGKPVSGKTNSVTTSTSNSGNWWNNWAKGWGGTTTTTTINGDRMTVVARDADAEAEAEGGFWEWD